MSDSTSEAARTVPFRLTYSEEASRVVRGRVTLPAPSAAAVPYVLLVHGFKGFMDWGFFPELARRLAQKGIASVAFNASGSGVGEDLQNFTELEAFARDTLTRQLEDLDRVRGEVRAGRFPELDAGRGALFGHSRGGAVALIHAAEHGDYRAVVTWAALWTFEAFDQATKEAWRRAGHVMVLNARTGQQLRIELDALEDIERNRARLDVVAACARLTAPALLAHGTRDEAVGLEALERLLAAMPPGLGRGLRVEGAQHTFGATHPLKQVPDELGRTLDASVRFLADRLA